MDPSTVNQPASAVRKNFLGHPVGLYVCFFTEMWERFSFYGMKALLFLYLIKYHLFQDDNGYNLLGAYGGLVYAMPVIGGLLADRYLGMRKAVIFGGSLLVLGHLGMAFEGHQATLVDGQVVRDEKALQVFYFSLALIIMGVGFLKPNISTIVGRLYPDNDPRRDSGFTIFYAGINLGAFIAPLICAWLGETYGWKYGFGLAGIGMFLGLLIFIYGQRYLEGHGEPSAPERLHRKRLGLSTEYWIYLGAIAGLSIIWLLIQTHSVTVQLVAGLPAASPVLWAMHGVSIALLTGIIWFMVKHCNKVERDQMLAVLFFIFVGLIFFSLYEQTYGSWVAFSDRVMDRHIFGWDFSAGQLTALGALFIFVLTPLFAWLWPYLDRRGLNPSKPVKSALGITMAAVAFYILWLSTQWTTEAGLASIWFLVLAYLVLELGEMMLSPIGLSAVTELSVPRVVSLMMGAWFLGTAYSEFLAAELSKLSAMDTVAGQVKDIGEALAIYADLFAFTARIGVVAAIAVFVLAPWIKRLMHDHH
jgi:POT family proton-dependent oligopeptide transporter